MGLACQVCLTRHSISDCTSWDANCPTNTYLRQIRPEFVRHGQVVARLAKLEERVEGVCGGSDPVLPHALKHLRSWQGGVCTCMCVGWEGRGGEGGEGGCKQEFFGYILQPPQYNRVLHGTDATLNWDLRTDGALHTFVRYSISPHAVHASIKMLYVRSSGASPPSRASLKALHASWRTTTK
jgi:hypothetical protein